MSKIEGNACVDIQDHIFKDWLELCAFLQSRFQDAKTEDQLMNELFLLYQLHNESVTEFFQHIERLKVRIVEASDLSGTNKLHLDKIA